MIVKRIVFFSSGDESFQMITSLNRTVALPTRSCRTTLRCSEAKTKLSVENSKHVYHNKVSVVFKGRASMQLHGALLLIFQHTAIRSLYVHSFPRFFRLRSCDERRSFRYVPMTWRIERVMLLLLVSLVMRTFAPARARAQISVVVDLPAPGAGLVAGVCSSILCTQAGYLDVNTPARTTMSAAYGGRILGRASAGESQQNIPSRSIPLRGSLA